MFGLVLIFYYLLINNNINFKDTEWINESPKVLEISPDGAMVCFSVSEPAAVYWRLYTNESDLPKRSRDMTNAAITNNAVRFGGNITHSKNESYTNIMKGLKPNTDYYLAAAAVSSIGNFPRNIKKIHFKTLQHKNL